MKGNKFLLSTIALLGFIKNRVFAKNNYYLISIKRSENDTEYDNASEYVRNAIDELVNDRMNDIYNIIYDNQETFVLDNGQMDENLQELNTINVLTKRNENINKKFLFINKNRPQKNNNRYFKRDEEYIPIESNLVNHIAPILNYYSIRAYLSDDIVDKVRQLNNIIGVGKSTSIIPPRLDEDLLINKNIDDDNNNFVNETTKANSILKSISHSETYYDLNDIKKETGWSDVSIQEDAPFHLSVISQGLNKNIAYSNTDDYDTNYYYPSTAGKNIDIYFIDDGLFTNHIDFDKYEGTPDERIIRCEGNVYNGTFVKSSTPDEENFCYSNEANEFWVDRKSPVHGIMVASVAAGSKYGVAKKANIHMIAADYEDYDFITSLDYIKQNAKNPSKTIISISRGGEVPTTETSVLLQDKVNELTENGFIIVVAAGNENILIKKANFSKKYIYIYSSFDNVITVGASEAMRIESKNMDNAYDITKYSNYGPLINIIAPGNSRCASIDSDENKQTLHTDFRAGTGTSNATPMVAGSIALIMAEHPETKYNLESMKNLLIDMSLKNILNITGKKENTPNRFINIGKKSVYHVKAGKKSDNPDTPSSPTTSTQGKIYFEKPNHWNGGNIRAYIYSENSSPFHENAKWPGELMEMDNNHSNIYTVKIDMTLGLNRIIFNDGVNQCPGSEQSGFIVTHNGLYNSKGYVKQYNDNAYENDNTHNSDKNNNNVTIYYLSRWNPTFIHYQYGDNAWTVAPGKQMQYKGGYQTITIDIGNAKYIIFAFNNNFGIWDNNNGNNYIIYSPGSYIINNGKITSGSI